MKVRKGKSKMTYPTISMFTGAMGLDLDLEAAGLETRLALECEKIGT